MAFSGTSFLCLRWSAIVIWFRVNGDVCCTLAMEAATVLLVSSCVLTLVGTLCLLFLSFAP